MTPEVILWPLCMHEHLHTCMNMPPYTLAHTNTYAFCKTGQKHRFLNKTCVVRMRVSESPCVLATTLPKSHYGLSFLGGSPSKSPKEGPVWAFGS